MGILYIVSTPIGNLGDISLRAKNTLSQADIVICEDTRKAGLLLARLNIPKKELLSYYEENELIRIPQIISLLRLGKNVALVSNAGTPTISDPGYKLVQECVSQGIKVESIPGPSAILTALVSSGLPTDKFLFLGYLPLKPSKRQKIWQLITTMHCSMVVVTVVIYESPHRLLKTLEEIKKQFGDINIVICRELTKIYEEIRREKINDSIAHFEKTKPQGEFTLLFRLEAPPRSQP